MYLLTGDPERDFDRHEAEQENMRRKRPICYECGASIYSEECYEINDELICPSCLYENHRKFTDDYID